uniref:Uncharacterized protein n=1 Tax=Corvus moneduloides TaxID=1196302 RepID=A0A8C3DFD7_CORMO
MSLTPSIPQHRQASPCTLSWWRRPWRSVSSTWVFYDITTLTGAPRPPAGHALTGTASCPHPPHSEGAGLVLTRQQRKQCQNLLRHLAEQLPQLGMEGKLNVWILKPGAESQGRGKVLQLARGFTAPSVQVGRWVVQKYVERLLTIFGTKFDIRQWFVVTDWKPLTVWFYRDCYLRFCSWPFSLCHLDARHLCNVSVQKWYKTSPDQDPRVPPDKIWSNKQFQEYLEQLGQADAWHQVLVPGMKAAILNALRSAQDQVGFRKGSFELYGADFLVGEDCQPWLLEINSCPTMRPSSAVTRRLCANVQRDILRLVLDRKNNPTCSIGAFELIYKEVGWGDGGWELGLPGQRAGRKSRLCSCLWLPPPDKAVVGEDAAAS